MSLIDKTVVVRRGGSYLTIPVDAVDRYLAKGYDVVDSAGNVLKESVPHDVNALRIAYEKHVAKIKELESTILDLKRQLRNAAAEQRQEAAPAKPATPKRTRKT